jgi:YidC/Oxa1 family membrane protein insertase
MDRRTLLAVGLCFLIMLGWQKFYIEPNTPPPTQKVETAATSPAAVVNTVNNTTSPANSVVESAANTPLATHTGKVQKSLQIKAAKVEVGSGSRFFSNWTLEQYKNTTAAPGKEVGALSLDAVVMDQGAGEIAFDLQEFSYVGGVEGTLEEIPNGVRWSYADDKVSLTRIFEKLENSNWISTKIQAEFKDKKPNFLFVTLTGKGMSSDPQAQDRNLLYWTQDGIHREMIDDSIEMKQIATPVKWVGVTDRYFLMTLINQSPIEAKGLIQPLGPYFGRASLIYPIASNTISVDLKSYFGPKELEALRSVEVTLDHTVDFGWFTIFAYPLLKLMKWFYSLFHNWGVSIILLTLLVKIVTYPLTYKSVKSMREMSKLQPQLQKIREKYADDKEALNREMMSLMKTHGYNPAAGCLPILVQMPVFFALYRVLYSSIELYQAPFFGWIVDLSLKDPFYVTPILLTVTMYIQQKLTPNTATDPAQQKMMQFMPVIFGVFMVTLPSGLTGYMLVNALASIAQQAYLNKKLGIVIGTPPAKA